MTRFPTLILLEFIIAVITIPVLQSADDRNVTDRMALLDFKKQIIDDPLGIMATWNDSSHHCNWTGITCHPSNSRVRILNLMSKKIVGSLPPSLGNLSFLEGINLRFNSFSGELPQEMGRLSSLKHVNLTNNMFSGLIPSNLSRCTELTILGLDYNQLSGEIPSQLGSLTTLEIFGVGVNNLTGTFPVWIGNLSSRLNRFSLALNSFHGSIPPQIGRLNRVEFFQIYGNQFSGELPFSSIYNLTSLNYFSVTQNRLQGRIPPDIGTKCPNLEIFAGALNNFTGEIPLPLSNASRLALIDFSGNSLTGTVPSILGRLPFLYWINFELNLLGYKQAGDLNFISSLTNSTNLRKLGLLRNQFGGEIPVSVANLSTKLEYLSLGVNFIYGNIPLGMGNLINLTVLSLESNALTGSIPEDFGKLQKLNRLNFSGNKLTGMIPVSFGNLTSMLELYLDRNMLQGNMSPNLGNCTSLLILNVSSNNLTGSIPKEVMSLASLSIALGLARNLFSGFLPDEVSRLVHLKELDVSGNELYGAIPSSLSSCVSLQMLIMGNNWFEGMIPESLGTLRALEEIDFSHNNFSGKIPEFLGKLPFLRKLDLSYNDLEGEVLDDGIFSNASIVSIVGNQQLCGGGERFHLPSCLVSSRKSDKNLKLRWIIPVSVSAALVIVLTCSMILYYILRNPKRHDIVENEMHQGISYQELHRSTNGFSIDNLIGSGSFGSVYKGILGENGSLVAVKVLNLEQKGATKSFMDECAILKTIRHRNLLKIITVCSSFDHLGQEFRCLVTEFMVNGSLDVWLHPRNEFTTKKFNVMERMNIAIDVASALDYLHNHSHTPIIHCDLKPCNILLDHDFTAHVGDFGLSKFLLEGSSHHTLSDQLKGSIGYIPPEYGTSTQISTLGDVYSYGVVVLELFTAKRPTDNMFNNGVSIHEHVAMALPEHVMDVLDPSLIFASEEESEKEDKEREIHKDGNTKGKYLIDLQQFGSSEIECLADVLKIGISCSMSAPRDRMHISIVVNKLHSIRDKMRMAMTK